MENSNQPAFPPNAGWEHPEVKGLTKREYFAGLALQGLLSNPGFIERFTVNDGYSHWESICEESVELADMVLRKLW